MCYCDEDLRGLTCGACNWCTFRLPGNIFTPWEHRASWRDNVNWCEVNDCVITNNTPACKDFDGHG